MKLLFQVLYENEYLPGYSTDSVGKSDLVTAIIRPEEGHRKVLIGGTLSKTLYLTYTVTLSQMKVVL
jgi:hypothetical protein